MFSRLLLLFQQKVPVCKVNINTVSIFIWHSDKGGVIQAQLIGT